MKYAVLALAAGLTMSLALVVAGATSAASAAQAPSYTATLSDDRSCAFALTASWTGARVAKVYAQWYVDGTTFVGTMEAPGPKGAPNTGTLKGRTATFKAGPFASATTSHSWHVLVQFYDSGGAQLKSMDSNVDVAFCAVGV